MITTRENSRPKGMEEIYLTPEEDEALDHACDLAGAKHRQRMIDRYNARIAAEAKQHDLKKAVNA